MSSAADLYSSAQDMRDIVWPRLRDFIGGGEMRSCELDGAQAASDFDREAGIDCYQVQRGQAIRAFATRVQWKHRDGRPPGWYGRPHNTFSIRQRTAYGNDWTELAKRMTAVESQALMPSYVVQAYLERQGGYVQSIGLVNARHLYDYVYSCLHEGREFEVKRNGDGSSFIYVRFEEVDCWRWFGPRPWEPDPQGQLFEAARVT